MAKTKTSEEQIIYTEDMPKRYRRLKKGAPVSKFDASETYGNPDIMAGAVLEYLDDDDFQGAARAITKFGRLQPNKKHSKRKGSGALLSSSISKKVLEKKTKSKFLNALAKNARRRGQN